MGIGGGLGVVLEGVRASVAALDALEREDASLASGLDVGFGVGAGVDVLQRRYEIRLERLEVASRLEAQLAGVKAQDAVDAVGFQEAMTPPDASVQDRTYAQMSVVEEIAGVLTVSSGAAGALVEQSRRICSLPLVMNALAAGVMSWQHARIVADETEGLDAVGAAGLVAHFFDPATPDPARGAAPGELVPSRFRAKIRGWRERHHPESIQKRHAKGVADRRMEYTPDRDGMAWISLYLPGDTACAIWNRTTATARGLQGPDEPRTLSQLRPDIAASLLLGAGRAAGEGPHQHRPGHAGCHRDREGPCAAGRRPGHRARVLAPRPHRRTSSAGRLRPNPGIHGPQTRRRWRGVVLPGPRRPTGRGAPGNRPQKLPAYRGHQTLDQAARCPMHVPGCTNKTPDNETDHLQAWEHGGTTNVSNLAQLCRKHHRLKHHSQWAPGPATSKDPPGWTSPTGRHYNPEQQESEPTHWPPGSLPPHAVRGAVVAGVELEATGPAENAQRQQFLASMPPWSDPPVEEPPSEDVLDPGELCPADPLWDEFHARFYELPADPQADWQCCCT